MPPASSELASERPAPHRSATVPVRVDELRAVLLEMPGVDRPAVSGALSALTTMEPGSQSYYRAEHHVRHVQADERMGLGRKGPWAVYELLVRLFEDRAVR